MTRYLPPLVCAALLVGVLVRTLERPQRGVAQAAIRERWEDPSPASVEAVRRAVEDYLGSYTDRDDRRFAAHALLRARRLGEALRVRWPDLGAAAAPAEVRGWAGEALRALAFEDEAGERATVHAPALLALVEGGDALARTHLSKALREGPIVRLYTIMRTTGRSLPPSVRELVVKACRERAAAERQAGRPGEEHAIAAAFLALRAEVYPEREADLALLAELVGGPFRIQASPRWTIVCLALGSSEAPLALETLRRIRAGLSASALEQDRRDARLLHLALLAGGDWSAEGELWASLGQSDPNHLLLRTLVPGALVDRWLRRDPRAGPAIGRLWDGPGLSDAGLRERVAHALLLGEAMAGADVPVERMLADLGAPDATPGQIALGLAARHRRGEAGARARLLTWLAGQPDEPLLSADPDSGAARPVLEALRALYLYE